MERIRITVGELENKTKILQENETVIKEALYNIKKVAKELNDNWQSDSMGTHLEKLEACEHMSFVEFTNLCEMLTCQINNIVDEYRYTEERLYNSFFNK